MIGFKWFRFFQDHRRRWEYLLYKGWLLCSKSKWRFNTLKGEIVQGTAGPINIDGKDVSIDTGGGRVIVDGYEVGTLDIVDLENREFLRKIGGQSI